MSTAHDADESVDVGRKATERAGGTSLYARDWGDDDDAPRPVHPAPEVTQRPAEDGEMGGPRSGIRAITKNLGVGWHHGVRYSRGAKPLAVKPFVGPVLDVVRISFRHDDGVAAIGLWHSGKFHAGFAWTRCADDDCPRRAVEHCADIPLALGGRELARLVKLAHPNLIDMSWRD